MSTAWPLIPLGQVLSHRKEFITIDDTAAYKRCRVQLHAKGIVERDRVPGATIRTKEQQLCRANELLVAEIDAKVGGFGIVPPELEGAIVSSHYFLFTPHTDSVDPEFLGYFVKTPAFRDQVTARGSTNYAAIRPHHVLGYQIPLPPLAEQRRIVAKIERVAAKIGAARGLRSLTIEEVAVLRRSSYRSAEAWATERGKRVRLAEVIESHDSGWSPACDEVPAGEGEWGVLKTTSVQWDGFNAFANKVLRTGLAPRPEITVKNGDVLVTRAGPMDRVGVACTVRSPPPMLMLSDKIIRIVADQRILPEYLSTCIGMPSPQEILRQGKTGLAASQVNISRPKLLNLEILVPSLDLQRRIIAYLDGLQAKVDRLKALQAQTRAELDALLPSILDRAFNGEL